MSTYQTLKGLKVKFLGADTSGDRVQEGEIFYNSVDYGLKSHIAVGAWSAGSNLITLRSSLGGAGTQTAGLAFGGRNNPDSTATVSLNSTEEYNGSGWANGGNLNTARFFIGNAGTQTAALGASGYVEGEGVTANVEAYDGSSWTEGPNVSTARFGSGGCGTSTAALIAGGREPSFSAKSEEWNGTAWAEGNDLVAVKTIEGAMVGSQTASVAFGGNTPPRTANV